MINDVLELDLLSQLDAKRIAETRVSAQQAWGLKRMMGLMTPSQNGSTTAAAAPPAPSVNPLPIASEPELITKPHGIMNRSPITYNHYYTNPPGTTVIEPPRPMATGRGSIWPWLLTAVLALSLGALAWYLITRPKPTTPPNWTDNPQIILK